MSFDHRASIIAYIEDMAARAEVRSDGIKLRALAGSLEAGLDMEPGKRSVASPIHAIAVEVSKRTRISVDEIMGRSTRDIVVPSRLATIWLAIKITGWSSERVAHVFGYHKPETIRKALERADDLRRENQDFRMMTDSMVTHEYCCDHCGERLVSN